MKRYLVLAMRKPSFDVAVVAPHKAFLDFLREQGKLHLTGGFSDGSGGAYVLENIADLAEATAIVATDPLAIHDSSELTIHEWNTR
ncbi:YciI family protein [Stenotrophomonas sp. YIM B06876]|uniref:YciI family protein n=1 Tax=Stenotrophomonas sp. YIM B06876 TaxID=3060211 RepID=UPI00273A41EE|nr:YciI family protein [Stenotrophomonas sp. YIM B06876]